MWGKVKIEYADGKAKVYVDGVMRAELPEEDVEVVGKVADLIERMDKANEEVLRLTRDQQRIVDVLKEKLKID